MAAPPRSRLGSGMPPDATTPVPPRERDCEGDGRAPGVGIALRRGPGDPAGAAVLGSALLLHHAVARGVAGAPLCAIGGRGASLQALAVGTAVRRAVERRPVSEGDAMVTV